MKINKKSKKISKVMKIAVIVISALLLIGLLFFGLEVFHITNFTNRVTNQTNSTKSGQTQTIDNNAPTEEQKAAAEAKKKEANDTITNNDLGISISYINTSVDPVQIRSVISGTVSNSGTCKLTLTKNGEVITKTSETYALPNSSTCKGFNISKSELDNGVWQLELAVSVNGKESSVADSFTLEQ